MQGSQRLRTTQKIRNAVCHDVHRIDVQEMSDNGGERVAQILRVVLWRAGPGRRTWEVTPMALIVAICPDSHIPAVVVVVGGRTRRYRTSMIVVGGRARRDRTPVTLVDMVYIQRSCRGELEADGRKEQRKVNSWFHICVSNSQEGDGL